MKTKIGILVLVLFSSFFSTKAQQRVRTTTRAITSDISDNLDLDAVSSIFADSKNLEDFEYRLNDPDNRISNLDLNQDGYVDYLRVIETATDNNSLVVIQAVLDKDIYQDVATIEIERRPDGNHSIQIVGDAYIYGANYIIEPEFVRPPLIFSFFWGPRFSVWNSPYYWGYYPRWYSNYRPYPIFKYQRFVSVHIDRRVTFNRTNERHFNISDDSYSRIRRNDYATRYPDRAFENRHRDVRNRNELIERRDNNSNRNSGNKNSRQNSQVRPENRGSSSGNNSGSRTRTETRSPQFQSNPSQNQINQNNRATNRSRTETKTIQEQRKPNTINRATESPKRDQVTREKAINRMESAKKSSAPRAKSVNVQKESKVKSEPKQSSRSSRKTDTQNKAVDRGNNRR